MTDKLDTGRRSENMRRIRSKDTSPELTVRPMVHRMGFRYKLHDPSLPGKPDLVFPRLAKVIDVKGCFWHCHSGCIDSHVPKSRREYSVPKLKGNRKRDARNARLLKAAGWDVLLVWECETRDAGVLHRTLSAFLQR